MINLLPKPQIKEYRAARANTLLLRYVILCCVGLIIMLSLFGLIYFMLMQAKNEQQAIYNGNTQAAAEYSDVAAASKEFEQNLATAKNILANEVRYSNVPVAVASALPSGVILNGLEINEGTFDVPVSLNAQGKSYEDALRLKENFQNSDYFSDVSLQSVTEESGNDSDYGYSIVIQVTMNKEALTNAS
ncbi:PilN domain-containing protein [Candidatus Saccharibacteria bacterium]|nr:PilN domain-containing protein [Candidatus Saccharibacteria bacterium]